MWKITHFKKDCIGCGACAAVAPEYWEMDEHGFAQLKGAKEADERWELEIFSEEARAKNQEAADVCPMNIIRIDEISKETRTKKDSTEKNEERRNRRNLEKKIPTL